MYNFQLVLVFKGIEEDMQVASRNLISAIKIRERYQAIAQQSFPRTVAAFIQNTHGSRVTDKCLANVLETVNAGTGYLASQTPFKGFDETKFGKNFSENYLM